ncbi:zinc finger, CCHC-type containing protein [Tanacetum coccineum]|uniref:Zinc finger, CCHC-type containing protein n=1 Tax=Tanacetum coccineum TaxID=301880 RepID=A0ABQ5CRJ4_9ASTR
MDFKHTLKHLKEELTLVELGSHLRIEESLRMQDSDKPKSNNVAGPRFCYVYLLHSKDEALDKFKVFKTEVKLQQGSQIKRFRTDKGGEYMDTLYFQSVGIIHETTAPYTPQQNGISERKNRVLKEMVNSMLSYSGLSQGFWGEAMLTACYLLNRVPNKRNRITPYELWTKRKPNLNYLRVWGCRAVVRLPDPKLKTLGERGIECIFVGYAEHSKAFRFYVIEPNDSVAINSIIESRDAIFDENRFSSVPRPSLSIPKGTEDIGGSVVPEVVTDEVVQQPESELRKSKRNRTPKDFGPEFQLYLIEGTRDEVSDQHSYCFNVEDDPKTFDEAIKSQDVAFWKEAINDEMDSIMGNNTWVLADLPPGCKPLGCKWIFKRKLKVDGTIEKFKARLVIQGFKQKSRIDYFDTYALVARISTIRLLIAMASIHNLIIHQMDVKTPFLNGELDEEAPKQWHQKFDEVVLSNGYLLNQADKCVYRKFDEFGKRVIICLYVDDMLIFGTDQVHVDLTKEFLSSRFSMKDRGDDCYLGIWIKLKQWNSNFSVHYIKRLELLMLWASKKQTCITGSIMESEFVALEAAGKEAECVATLAKAYSQMYNGKSRHLGVRHSMIRELITNGVISIEFVRSQQNLADHLTNGLARDLVISLLKGWG